MRLLALVFALLFAAGCGSASERTGVPASSGPAAESSEGTVPAEGSGATTEIDESELKPPKILLVNEVGDAQRAVQGSFCIDYVDEASGQGSGVCGDSGVVHPDAVTVAAAGDSVSFVLRGAEVVRAEGCRSDDDQECVGYVYVRPLGCEERELERVPLSLGPETRWTVDLERGAYELDAFAHFRTSAGANGDVSGALGLLVGGGPKEDDALGVTGIEPAMLVCPFSD